jgi:phosphomannomutase/phosphoglucomutase
MKPGIFREYDIRALADKELNNPVVEMVGKAFGTYLLRLKKNSVVMALDNRLSSPRIFQKLKKGILSTGCNVIDVGETTTPVLCYAMFHLNVHAYAMVTGSHTPAEFNGIKFQIDTQPLSGKNLLSLFDIASAKDFILGIGQVSAFNVTEEYINLVKSKITLARPMKLVVDCGNGCSGKYILNILQELGCEVIPLYCESDGRFPNHHPDPADAKNLRDLCNEVKRVNADAGIAFDGDGNRIGVVDDKGAIVSPDILLGLFGREIKKNKGDVVIVCDVKASQALVDDVNRYGGKVIMSRTGYPFILQKIFELNADIGGELTGHICFNQGTFVFGDAIFVACRLAELLSNTSVHLSELLTGFPLYISSPEIRLPCSDHQKFQVVSKISHYFSQNYKHICVDGIRVLFDTGGWALIRASNTEPKISIRIEAKNKTDLLSIRTLLISQLQEIGVNDLDFPSLM